MSEDERLREALLELQLLREREARSLQETRTLLHCVEAFSAAPSPEDALRSIFTSLSNKIGADRTALCSISPDGSARVLASDDQGWVGCHLVPPRDLSDRPRNLMDHTRLGHWDGDLNLDDYGAMLVAPFPGPEGTSYLLISLRKRPDTFPKEHLNLVTRLSGLAVQALISGRIATENTLLAATIQGSSSGFAIADATGPDRPLVYVNPAFEALSGYSAEDVIGLNCRFLSAEPEDAPERVRLRETVASGGTGRFLLRNRRKSGELFWNDLTLFPVHDANGALRNLVATQNDVTERIEAERERDRIRTRMEQSLAATEEAFLILEEGETVIFANAALRACFPAHPTDWAVGTGFAENWGAYLENCRDMPGRITRLLAVPDLSGLAALPAGREITLPDGRSVLVRAAALGDGGLVITATDVTPMKTAQTLLQQRLAAIEAAHDGIAIVDDDGRLTYLNGAAARMLGYASSVSALGRKWVAHYPDADAPKTRDDHDITLTREAEGRLRTHDITLTPLAEQGSVILIRDVTERIETEEREEELKLALLRSQRQEAVAQLAAGIAHDFNNLLSAISGSAALISMTPGDPSQVAVHADRVASAGSRAARLVNRLLDLGTHDPSRGAFDLRSALSDLRALVSPSLSSGTQLSIELPTETLLLRGDPGEINQAMVNLVLNARDALGDRPGQIEVRAEPVETAGPLALQSGPLPGPAAYVRIAVSDTGPGMTEATAARALEPYFTTKGRRGTGLGLAMVAMQARAAGGGVDIRSTIGEGTTVSVYWPLSTPGRAAPNPAQVTRARDLKGMTIIIVDDEIEVAEVLQTFLEAHGAETAVCTEPADALEAVEEDPMAWSAVITDYDMPGMTGGDLAERLHSIAPELPVFLVTALARRLSDPRVAEGRIAGVFAKPVDLDHLCERLGEFQPGKEQSKDPCAY